MRTALSGYTQLADIRVVEGGYEADTLKFDERSTIMGAHLVFQLVVAAERTTPSKRLLTLQTLFANGGRVGEPLSIAVETLQSGRSFSSLTITARQQQTVVARAQALMTTEEDDYLRHQSPAAAPARWADWPLADPFFWPGWLRHSPDSTPERACCRVGLDQPILDMTIVRALAAAASEQRVMHEMVLLANDHKSHRSRARVLSHTINLLEPVLSTELVLTTTASYAGGGRASGHGQIAYDDGRLLATYSTTGLFRAAGN